MPAVSPHHQVGTDLLRLSVDRRLDANDLAAILDQARRLGMHQHSEGRVALALGGEEIEEVPLRHHAGRAATDDAALGGDRRHSSNSRNTRPVAVMASSAGTPSGPLTHSLVAGVELMQSLATRSGLCAP